MSVYGDKVQRVWRDFPLNFHKEAQKAAEAGMCAAEQGKFWEFHDKLFENQRALQVDKLKTYAADMGLDTGKFDACLDGGKYEADVKQDLAQGQAAGVTGTPAFFVNGRFLSGAQPYEEFVKIIEEELALKGVASPAKK
jgi:protein-disulfide isomerase